MGLKVVTFPKCESFLFSSFSSFYDFNNFKNQLLVMICTLSSFHQLFILSFLWLLIFTLTTGESEAQCGKMKCPRPRILVATEAGPWGGPNKPGSPLHFFSVFCGSVPLPSLGTPCDLSYTSFWWRSWERKHRPFLMDLKFELLGTNKGFWSFVREGSSELHEATWWVPAWTWGLELSN